MYPHHVHVCMCDAGGEFPINVSVPAIGDNQTIVIVATDPTDGSRFISTISIGNTGTENHLFGVCLCLCLCLCVCVCVCACVRVRLCVRLGSFTENLVDACNGTSSGWVSVW